MRKRLITATAERSRTRGEGWLDVERAAVVEVTSEDKDFPVESAFVSGDARGWRAAAPGSQTIRLIFDHPQRLRCISLIFEEGETERTQEFVLRWSSDPGSALNELVRQQWNFSPPESVREAEEYQVELSNVAVLELVIKPDIGGGVVCPDVGADLQAKGLLVALQEAPPCDAETTRATIGAKRSSGAARRTVARRRRRPTGV
jgi:hypothetical protein